MKCADGTLINVFVTRSNKWRARIKEPGAEPYEVTVNGETWQAGKGRAYENDIIQMVRKKLAILEREARQAIEARNSRAYEPMESRNG